MSNIWRIFAENPFEKNKIAVTAAVGQNDSRLLVRGAEGNHGTSSTNKKKEGGVQHQMWRAAGIKSGQGVSNIKSDEHATTVDLADRISLFFWATQMLPGQKDEGWLNSAAYLSASGVVRLMKVQGKRVRRIGH